jgi:hypothetical protein
MVWRWADRLVGAKADRKENIPVALRAVNLVGLMVGLMVACLAEHSAVSKVGSTVSALAGWMEHSKGFRLAALRVVLTGGWWVVQKAGSKEHLLGSLKVLLWADCLVPLMV